MHIDSIMKTWKHSKPFRDLAIIIVVGIVVLAVSVYFELFDKFAKWYIRQNDPYEIDELVIVLLFFGFAFTTFSWRRWRELIHEIILRKRVEEESDKIS